MPRRRQRAIFDGVVFVDLRSPWHELEREAAVFGELLEHVIEEADAGRNGDRRGGVEIHRDVDVGFLGRAADRRAALGELAQDRGPGFPLVAVTAHHHPRTAEIAREFHVRLAIAHHRAAGEIDVTDVFRDQLRLRLAAIAAVGLAVRADEHRVELDAPGS